MIDDDMIQRYLEETGGQAAFDDELERCAMEVLDEFPGCGADRFAGIMTEYYPAEVADSLGVDETEVNNRLIELYNVIAL